jgi:hypothetical protein
MMAVHRHSTKRFARTAGEAAAQADAYAELSEAARARLPAFLDNLVLFRLPVLWPIVDAPDARLSSLATCYTRRNASEAAGQAPRQKVGCSPQCLRAGEASCECDSILGANEWHRLRIRGSHGKQSARHPLAPGRPGIIEERLVQAALARPTHRHEQVVMG